jgi:O-antigen/teichoic acid export membrane protein
MFLLALPAAALFFFGDRCLALWISPQTAQIAGSSLKVLAVAFLLNGCSATAYAISVAADRTTIPLRVNFFGTLLYVPALLLLIPRWGITGCAFAFLGLNAYYLLFFIPAVHRAVLQMSPAVWFRSNVVPFTAAACVLFSVVTAFRSMLARSKLGLIETCCVVGALYAAAGFRILAEPTRARILNLYQHIYRTVRI